jgi:hypothetical protein
MGILEKLRPLPRWKHADPAVRAAAVYDLGPDEHEALRALAREDADGRVRRAAVARLDDVEVLGELPPVRSGPTNYEVHAFLARVRADATWRPNEDEVVEVLTPAVDELAAPGARRELLFTSSLWPEGRVVDGIPVGDRVLWGMTLRLLDDLVPRLLAGEWDDRL